MPACAARLASVRIERGVKFGLFFLSRCEPLPDVPQGDEEIAPGVWVNRQLGFDMAAYWREWLGSVAIEGLAHDGLALYVTMASENPDTSDAESIALQQRASDILNALLLQGVPAIERGLVGHGAKADGDVRLRSYTSVGRHYFTTGIPPLAIGMEQIHRAMRLADRLRSMLEAFEEDRIRGYWSRVLRGSRILLTANRTENTLGDRLHQFVRVTEALLRPSIGNSRNEFAHRAQTFALANEAARTVLLQLYDLRSAVEHMNVPHEVIPGDTVEERIALVSHRTRQADVLARFSLLRVLETGPLLEMFRTDAGIDSFWQLHDYERIQACGPRLDISAVP
jgi:hypothetical protein